MRINKLTALLAICLALFATPLLYALLPSPVQALENTPVVQIAYFYSEDCPHCQVVQEEILKPMQAQYGSQLDVRKFEISSPAAYELLIRVEQQFKVRPEERGIPTLLIGDKVLIGEDAIRAQLPAIVQNGIAQGGIPLANIPGLDALPSETPAASLPGCKLTTTTCTSPNPVWAAYFYQTGCQKCSRAEADLAYVKSVQSQLIIDQFNIYDNPALATWLGERIGRQDVHTPALFIGNDALIGEAEISPDNIQALIQKYSTTGTQRTWAEFSSQSALIERFRALGPLTVVFAGLVDGLNPCAFATLVFFISYLTFAGRKGREVIAVGGAFTFGVFLAYFGVGLGLYKVLDMLGSLLTVLSRWVYAITAILCAILAVYSFFDYLKARQGAIQDMTLRLPPALRKRVNAVVRSGAQARTFVTRAFITGVVVSLIELACTGQIYLPTIIFVTSVPELRVQAISYLLLYNLVFILPLIVVFILAYYGTTSVELGRFLERNTSKVKLGAVLLFASLATWLGLSLFV